MGSIFCYTIHIDSFFQDKRRRLSRYDLTIIEDDPYRLLHFGGALEDGPVPGLDPSKLPPSFLSVDTDGRVVRCDTCSKWVSPGLRCGWLTAPAEVIAKIAQGTGPSLGVSSVVQVWH